MTREPESKAHTRARLRRARAALDAADRDRAGSALRAAVGRWWDGVGPGAAVASFQPMPSEPPVDVVNADLHARGATVLLPVCEPDFRLRWARWTPTTTLVRSALVPIDHPPGPTVDLADPRAGADGAPEVALLLVPALAVDATGQRLGQGGGYYDRFLARWRDRPGRGALAAVVYDDEVLPAGSFDVMPHDQPVDLVFTPERVIDLRSS
ncbi:5-formyltetrahydrofolate cyclo-ligase [Tersicoccus solisilvae]|uniref:5-formyltetrahydrofolate cyclo-ligase n=1 Tax=Tersicoccus solisilvae TaxID=1882339 RepID=A0ABQ1NVH0_9MICC|nr:5-formyltetrahydrofolate cyclo-ligase [Tersicoccus solisilvae]GGC85540.1 5-formyltetrahydrofolate cyclo-ligase [Tersicoccus solisilvae]